MTTFREEYRELNEVEKAKLRNIKIDAGILYNGISAESHHSDIKADPRMIALAKTKLEESVMWAVKAITG